jgi:hypothetical protein
VAHIWIWVPHLRDSLIVANRGPRQLAGGVSFGGHSRESANRAQERKDFPNYVLRLRTKSCNFSESTPYSHLPRRTMRRLFAALVLSLSFALPAAAHADSFQYTIVWDLSHVVTSDTSAYIGTYTFTVDSLLTGNTFVYGAVSPDPQYPAYPYIYVADFTVPSNSKVAQIEISYFPDYSQYGFGLYQTAGGSAVTTSLLQDPNDPNMFFADYGQWQFFINANY